MVGMNRRRFIRAALSSWFIPYAMTAASAAAKDVKPARRDYFFFDERFAEAKRLASGLAGSSGLTAVQSDMTDVWNAGLSSACLAGATMQGVTTESFYFCLRIMAGEHARTKSRITRVDRNLYLWTIRSGGHFDEGHPI